MSDPSSLQKTQPISMASVPYVAKVHRRFWILVGILILIILVAVGGYLGYLAGIRERLALQTSDLTKYASVQFDLGVVDIQAGRLQIAATRFVDIINIDPSFPGAADRLAEVLIALNLTQTPTIGYTPTSTTIPMTPTPDTRNQAQLLTEARQDIVDKNWDDAIASIETLRKLDLTYQAVEADDIYYFALRNRGIQEILVEGQLEQGLYDLALAERFGPLDADAVS